MVIQIKFLLYNSITKYLNCGTFGCRGLRFQCCVLKWTIIPKGHVDESSLVHSLTIGYPSRELMLTILCDYLRNDKAMMS